MVNDSGHFSIDWGSKLSELHDAAVAAKQYEHAITTGGNGFFTTLPGLDAEYKWVTEAFDELRQLPDPGSSETITEIIEKVSYSATADITGDQGTVDNAEVRKILGPSILDDALAAHDRTAMRIATLAHWSGAGARAFNDYFGDIPNTIRKQADVTNILTATMKANEFMLRCACIDAENIPDATINALEALKSGTSAEDGGARMAMASAVATVVAGVATVASGGTAALAAGAATVFAGGTAGMAADAATNSSEEMPIKGHTVDQVLSGMIDAITAIFDRLKECEDTVIASLTAASKTIEANPEIYVARRPEDFVTNGAAGYRPS